jgi:hypothetical protein
LTCIQPTLGTTEGKHGQESEESKEGKEVSQEEKEVTPPLKASHRIAFEVGQAFAMGKRDSLL